MRILIANASAIIRVILEQRLSEEKNIQLLNSVSNGRKAIDKAREENPDIVILDHDMTEMDGAETAKVLTEQMGIPVVLFCKDENEKFEFARPSAVKLIKKPKASAMDENFFVEFIQILKKMVEKVILTGERVIHKKSENSFSVSNSTGKFAILCIGASTGGPTAVQSVLQDLGENFPLPILYAQHIEVGDDENMAEWFSENLENMEFSLAKDGEEALPAHVYMAPANRHLVIDYINSSGNPILHLNDDPPMRFLKPAVDKTFFNAASIYKEKCLAVLMTGMGADGAAGCKAIVDAGGFTIAEDESTCAVFGMPAAAIEMGGASIVLRREKIAEQILSFLN